MFLPKPQQKTIKSSMYTKNDIACHGREAKDALASYQAAEYLLGTS